MSQSDFRAWLGDLYLDPRGVKPSAGSWCIALRTINGWKSRAQDGTDASEHWSGQGQSAGAPKVEARQVSLECAVIGSSDRGGGSPEAGLDALSRLSRTTLTVAEDARGLVRCADVRLVQPQDSRISPTVAFVTLSLTADDPLRYSAESRSLANGTMLLPNRGDAAAFGRLFLMGPHSAITIAHPGGTWTFPALGSGESRLVDWRELRVWQGVYRTFGEGSGPAPRVLPGGSQWTVSGLGSGIAVLSRAEAWS